MSKLKTAAKRLVRKDIRRPLSPVQARDSYPSYLFSLHDQTPAPSPRLFAITLDCARLILDRKVDLDDLAARPHAPHWLRLWPGEHYLLLAATVRVLRPKTIIEIGTFTGLSALAMKKYLPDGGRIVTFDVRPWASIPQTMLSEDEFADGRLEQRLADLSDPRTFEKQRDLFESADFLFIDGPKDGVFEYKLMELFKTVNPVRQPVLLFDDTKLWSMLRFWRELPYPKLDITSLGSWSGTGLVEAL